ncbi:MULTISPECIES: phage tail protein [Stenotrophomonas]|uniref:phage tail protein n=1 Tax=Stenotrophomonas TaxID=40323 RepID=UPI0008722701|nr:MULTISPECIES: phage tail protein [Stenotrophomonas]OEZ02325.1 phage tail protein [Stenotrophomonas sp. BIIR7]
MTDTFIWKPTSSGAATANAAVRKAAFGDGYTQRAKDGINARSRSYQLTFTGAKERIDAIIEFLDAHIGQSFFWTGPRGTALYTCDTHNEPLPNGLTHTVTATFEQTFQP